MDKGLSPENTLRWLEAIDFNQQVAAQEQEMRDLLLSFLEVLDSFDRCSSAIDHDRKVPAPVRSWLRGYERVRRQLVSTMEQAGVSFMNCQGQPFDPHRHEAIQARHQPDVEDGIILEEIARGCEWKDTVLRRAKVVVSKGT